ncbi:MAG: (Fe-S)-binding protein [Anaerolineales bacterium]
MSDDLYLDRIVLTETKPCLAEPGKIIVTGNPSRSLKNVLPYVASLPSVISFNPDTLSLAMRRSAGLISMYPDRVSITQVEDLDQGLELLNALADLVNFTWANRRELSAVKKRKRPPRPLDIYPVLPGTNCKQCGKATCMAFAYALLNGERSPRECTPLYNEPTYQDRRQVLENTL